ncbi:class F sortase [Paenibacillus sp. GM2]|uniref:class F sortase n=1 Tax=Paenibacillus sp. GM2 TaxID=1622070 RepID=UPI000840A0EC|nr:class F sortase [Paenibacillus sp. GM2]
MLQWKLTIVTCLIALACSSCSAPETRNTAEKQTDLPQTSAQSQSNNEIIEPNPPAKTSENAVHNAPVEPFLPHHLYIPSINAFAQIMPVGVAEDGRMDVPEDTEVVGILQPGVLAGGQGNVIMDGHVDSYTGPAIFFNLKKLRPGDTIIVSNKTGQRLIYAVESVETFITAEAPLERIFGDTDEYRLNLITCTGKYSRKKKEHEMRLVVFAKLQNEP